MTPAQSTVAEKASETVVGEHLSYSQIRTYAECPLKYHLSRTYKPEFLPSYLPFGSAFHQALHEYNLSILCGKKKRHRALVNTFCKAWLDGTKGQEIRYTKGQTAEEVTETAVRMLAAAIAQPMQGEILAAEEKFVMEIDPELPPVVGTVDLMLKENGKLWLEETKTSANKPATVDDMDEDQLLMYGWFAAKSGIPKSMGLKLGLRFRVFTKQATTQVVLFDVEPSVSKFERLLEKTRQIADGIKTKRVYPVKSWKCKSCQYQGKCSKWPNIEKEDEVHGAPTI